MPDEPYVPASESDDIVRKLGDNADEFDMTDCPVRAEWCREGAAEIEQLRAKCCLLEADLAFHVGWREEITRKLGDTDA